MGHVQQEEYIQPICIASQVLGSVYLLEEEDVCVFALKEKELARTVLVHIFRVVPVSSTNSTFVHSHYAPHEIFGTSKN